MQTKQRIIHGDCLEVLPTLPKATLVWADPPDNLGVRYAGLKDMRADYKPWLYEVIKAGFVSGEIFWLSYYHKYQSIVMRCVPLPSLAAWRQFVWHFTFGQHRHTDCGNNYRPLLRLVHPGAKLYPDAIRVESERQRLGDKRADPRGRVPGDVWTFSRVCGNFPERRKWCPTQHPKALVERVVLFSTKPGDLVVDMFGGTFSMARACKRLGRDCISIEISEDYCLRGAEELKCEVEVQEV
ncbi:MAG: DNA-methyltransferase [Planctomycetota bacterium]